jgi:hypothetical protein
MATKKKQPPNRMQLVNELGGNDEIVFHIEWDPDRISASLDHLIYNGDLIDDGTLDERGGAIALTFHRASSLIHRFQWSLLFPGKKLLDLKAGATVNGKDADLDEADDAENRWASQGDWEGKEK